jgi:hypothetical protein
MSTRPDNALANLAAGNVTIAVALISDDSAPPR